MLGLVASGRRNITSGSQYEKFFTEQPEGNEVTLRDDGDVYDTLKLMRKLVNDTLSQTKAISQELKGSSREDTARNIWDFLYHNVQYKKDNPLREQLRTPARTWKDRKRGVDCDCYSIFISSVLTNLGISHTFRIAGYKGDFQHVYVVVPRSGKNIGARNSYLVIDPVVDRFNYEVPFNKKHDHSMAKVTMLNGIEGEDSKCAKPMPPIRYFVPTQQVIDEGKIPSSYFLKKYKIPYTPVFDEQQNQASYVIQTPAGAKPIPTVISREEAQNILNVLSTPAEAQPAQTDVLPESASASLLGKKIPWLWIAAGFGALWLVSTNNKNKPVAGLGGASEPALSGVKKKKHTKSKKKYPTITL